MNSPKTVDVCIDARMAFSSGIGTYIREVVSHFNCSPFRPVLLVDRLHQPWCSQFEQILFSSPIYSVKEQLAFPAKIPRCDLFFSPHYNVPLLPIRAKKRAVMIHDVFHLAFASQLRWYERFYAKYVIDQAVSRSDLILTNSEFSRREICKYTIGARDKIHPISCGVNRHIFQRENDPHRIQKIIQQFLLPSRYFLFVGNLKPHKNLKGLLFAMRKLPSDVGLVILGKSEGMNYVDTGVSIYEQFPELKGRVSWISSVTNEHLPVFYQLAEALVFPSYYEGFGLPPLEAMSCGCPVIVSHAASLPEVCGSAALYISPGNPKEISLAMKKIIADGECRKRLIEEGYKNVEKFKWETSVRKHLELFENLFLKTI
jgi:glycosyltransferase involved in cell wall biosynthesis